MAGNHAVVGSSCAAGRTQQEEATAIRSSSCLASEAMASKRAENKNTRRAAARAFARLGQNLASPLRLSRDLGKEEIERFFATLAGAAGQSRRAEAEKAIVKWNEAAGQQLRPPKHMFLWRTPTGSFVGHSPTEMPRPPPITCVHAPAYTHTHTRLG